MGEIALTSEAAVAHASVFELANDAAQAFSEMHFAAQSTLWKLAWFKQPDESEIEVAIERVQSRRETSEPVRQVCVQHFVRRFAVSRVDWMPGFPASGREGMRTNAGSIG